MRAMATAALLMWSLQGAAAVATQQGVQAPARGPVALAMQAWEQPPSATDVDWRLAAERTQLLAPEEFVRTRLSTNRFWFSLTARDLPANEDLLVEFPSKHALSIECWDRLSGQSLGSANRSESFGGLQLSRSGFALEAKPQDGRLSWVCSSPFRGPAKINALLWTQDALAAEQRDFDRTAWMLEAGVGVLVLFMLVNTIVNRSALYLVFSGWLLMGLAMAEISLGSDFRLYTPLLTPEHVITLRQWTVTIYYALTIALFSTMFSRELARLRSDSALRALQLSAVAITVLGPFLSFEHALIMVWVATGLGSAVGLVLLLSILIKAPTRTAFWYGASIAVTLASGLAEVVSAGLGSVVTGINSFTGVLASVLLTAAAVAEHMRAERMSKQRAERDLKTAYEESPIGLFTAAPDFAIVKSNPAFTTLLAGTNDGHGTRTVAALGPVVQEKFRALLAGPANQPVDVEAEIGLHEKQTRKWFALRASKSDEGNIEASLQDISERVQAVQRLEFLASHDTLTECLNLRGLEYAVRRLKSPPGALAYFDLDRFKLINDLYGHRLGDVVLQQVCARLRAHLLPQDLLARVGGDEFVVVFATSDVARAQSVCEALTQDIASTPFAIGKQKFTLGISGGVVGSNGSQKLPFKDLVSSADTLCRMAKKQGNTRLVVMESSDHFLNLHHEELELIACLQRGETPPGLYLVMQPEISLTRPFDSLNFEVLLRLRKSDGTVLPAQLIIEAAEAHGKSAIIDRWVVATALSWVETHWDALSTTHFVGVNLSAGSLNDAAFIEELFSLLQGYPRALGKLFLEITETIALTDMKSMQGFIDRARAMGAKVGLDDFGAGFSSFGYLRGLSADALKLDGSLVKGSAQNPAGAAIITSIGRLVNDLGMKSIGEFAEDLPTIQVLVEAGIHYAQGYGISKPVAPEEILKAKSSAEFIQDPEILAYFQRLQSGSELSMPLFSSLH